MSTDEGGAAGGSRTKRPKSPGSELARPSPSGSQKKLRLLVAELRKALGDDRIVVARGPDAEGGSLVAPRTPSEVATILGHATALGVPIHFPVAPSAPSGPIGLRLDLSRLEHMLDLDLPSRVVTLQVGTKVSTLEERVAKEGLSLYGAHEPRSSQDANRYLADERLLAFALASERLEDRPLQQACIGLSAALPTGELVHVRPAPRRATGPDLMTFFLGKGFHFGIIVTVTMRLSAKGARVVVAPSLPPNAPLGDDKALERTQELAQAISRKIDPSGILV